MNAQSFTHQILKPALLPLFALCLSTAGASGQTPQPGIFEMAEPALTVTEGQPAITLKVRRSSAAGSGTAAATVVVNAGTDAVGRGELSLGGSPALPFSISFAPGQNEASISLAAVDDALYELGELVNVTIVSVSGGSIAAGRGVTEVTVADNDQSPFVNVNGPAVINEGSTGVLTVLLNTVSGTETRVDVGTEAAATGVPAITGIDYTLSTSTVVIPAGALFANVSVTCLTDRNYELAETFAVVMSSPVGARLGGTPRATIEIRDRDSAPRLSVSVPPAVGEGDGTVIATFTLSHASAVLAQHPITIRTYDDTAVAPGDYDSIVGRTISFADGQTVATTAIQIRQDFVDEGDEETFIVGISGFSRGILEKGDGFIDHFPTLQEPWREYFPMTILDDDATLPKLSVEFVTRVVPEGGTQTFRVSLDPPVPAGGSPVTVRIATGNGFAGELLVGTSLITVTAATPALDFVPVDKTLTFKPGVTSLVVPVSIRTDAVFEGMEAYYCALASPSGARIESGKVYARGVISNVGTIPNVTVAIADAREDEGVAVVTFTIPRSNETGSTITWSAQSGTAVADRDFGQVQGDVIYMEPGVTSYTRTVPLLQDDLSEGAETVLVNVAVSEGLTFTGGPISFRILDDESAPEVSMSNALPVVEGGVLRFAVELDRISSQPVSVQVRTADGTALAGGDYTAVNTTVTIPPGQTVGEVFVLTSDDTVDEGPQTLALNITGAEGATIGDASGAAEITDNDNPPVLTVTVPAAVDEGTSAVVQFTLDRASERSPRIVFSTQTGTAGAPADFSTVPATVLTFGPGQTSLTQSVTVHADAEVEPQESFDVVVSALTPDSVSYAGASRTIFIDNAGGAPRPALAVEPVHAVEFSGGSLSVFFPVEITEPAATALTLTCRTVDGTATAGTDFVGISAREIVIEPGETTGVVEVVLTPDAAAEMDEEFTLEVTGALGGQTLTASGRAYIYPAGIRHITSGNGTVVLTLPVGDGALLESTSQPDAVPWSTVPLSSEPGIQTISLPRPTARAFYRQRENR